MSLAPVGAEEPLAAVPAHRGALSAFAHHDFRYLLAGTMGSQMGDWIQTVGQGWLVYLLTGSAAQLGVFSFIKGIAKGIAVLVVSPFDGAIADRMTRRNLLSSSALVAAIIAVLLAVLVSTGQVRVWHLYVTAVIDDLVVGIVQPARQVMVYDCNGWLILTRHSGIMLVTRVAYRLRSPAGRSG